MTAKHDFIVRQGDTFRQRKIKVSVAGEPMDLTDAVVEMKIKHHKGGRLVSSFNPQIEGDGVINLPYWTVDLNPFHYVYDLQITTSNGHTLTYMEGKFIVEKDV